jgi:protein tyrosine phosphatase
MVQLGGNRYICTQAPLPNTTVEFWRMVWEQDCRVIVMLCNLTERKKVRCYRYWPSKVGDTVNHGGVLVELLKTGTVMFINVCVL